MRPGRDFRTFLKRSDGAVTADWVVLAGAAVALGLGVLIVVEPGVDQGSNRVANGIGNAVGENMGVDNTPSLASQQQQQQQQDP